MGKGKIIDYFKNTVPIRYWLYLLFFVIIFIFTLNLFRYNKYSSRINESPVIGKGYVFDLSSDKNRLDCIFEQRRCLFENIGLPKEETLLNCYGITYCEDKHGKSE